MLNINLSILLVLSSTYDQGGYNNQADFGVVMLTVNEKEFDVISFVNAELSLFVHTTHPLAQREKVELCELKNEKFILFNQELIYNLIIQECLQAGFRPKIAYEISEWGFISEMIGENIGISICPKPIAKKVNQDLIKVISIENPSIPWSLGFISKKRKHSSPAVCEFIKYISAELPFES